MSASPFLSLPAELRVRIYEHALSFQGILQRLLRTSVERQFTGHPVNVSLLCVCTQVNKEGVDVFFEVNVFRVSYHHLCTCENQFPYPAFRASRIRRLEVSNFLPRVDVPRMCELCQDSGLGLLKTLGALPRLQSLKVAFEDIFSFAYFAPRMLQELDRHEETTVVSDEVGRLVIRGLGLRVELLLPALSNAWLFLAGQRGNKNHLPGQETIQSVLKYLQFEANTCERTSEALALFFIPAEDDETRVLRFRGLPDESTRRVEFTVAIVGVLSDVFTEDGGSEYIGWVDIGPNTSSRRWDFEEGMAGPIRGGKRTDSVVMQQGENSV